MGGDNIKSPEEFMNREFMLKKEKGYYVDGFGSRIWAIDAIKYCHRIKDINAILESAELIDASDCIVNEAATYLSLQRSDYTVENGYGQAFYDAAHKMQRKAHDVMPDTERVDFVIAAACRKARLIGWYGKEA